MNNPLPIGFTRSIHSITCTAWSGSAISSTGARFASAFGPSYTTTTICAYSRSNEWPTRTWEATCCNWQLIGSSGSRDQFASRLFECGLDEHFESHLHYSHFSWQSFVWPCTKHTTRWGQRTRAPPMNKQYSLSCSTRASIWSPKFKKVSTPSSIVNAAST